MGQTPAAPSAPAPRPLVKATALPVAARAKPLPECDRQRQTATVVALPAGKAYSVAIRRIIKNDSSWRLLHVRQRPVCHSIYEVLPGGQTARALCARGRARAHTSSVALAAPGVSAGCRACRWRDGGRTERARPLLAAPGACSVGGSARRAHPFSQERHRLMAAARLHPPGQAAQHGQGRATRCRWAGWGSRWLCADGGQAAVGTLLAAGVAKVAHRTAPSGGAVRACTAASGELAVELQ